MTDDLDLLRRELVVANRVLAHENVIDAYGHVSMRHPHHRDRMLLSWSRSPELVGLDDILEFTFDGQVVGNDRRPPYRERFIHAAVYQSRPDVHAVVHAHAEDVLPFGIVDVPLRPVIHSGSFIGAHVPVWDIEDSFGPDTNLLVSNLAQGRDLAGRLGAANVVLMRGHGFTATAGNLIDVVRLSVYLPRNARVQMAAMRMGTPKYLTAGEINARSGGDYGPKTNVTQRAWTYWASRAGCLDLLPTADFSAGDPLMRD